MGMNLEDGMMILTEGRNPRYIGGELGVMRNANFLRMKTK